VEITTPHLRIVPGRIDQEEDQRGHCETSNGREHRNSGPGAVGQLADRELSHDFQSDNEEEERHQPVVDEVFHRHVEPHVAEAEPDRGIQQRPIALRPRRIRPENREDRGRQQ
jgi:hypothetical protein